MKLAIPSLEHTREAFLEHASVYESFDAALAKRFFSEAAPLLDERLKDYDQALNSSYLERNWTHSYLSSSAPLAVASNFCFKLPKNIQINDFIAGFAQLVSDYEAGKLEYSTPRGQQLCELQFSVLKGGCRKSARPFDAYVLNHTKSANISILKDGNCYLAPLFDEQNRPCGVDFSTLNAPSRSHSLAELSFFDTAAASEHYARLFEFNAFFAAIETSRMNLCVINKHFASVQQEREYMHYFAPCYHYKTLNFIYNEANGAIYINGEHSFLDGGTIAYILEASAARATAPASLARARLVEQFIDDAYCSALDARRLEYAALSSHNDLASFALNEATAKDLSKDFIMQAAIAYAARAVYGKAVCQYEAVDMREYDYGRTECVRAISAELLQALSSFSAQDFAAANVVHKNRIKACKKGLGIDRHLLALSWFVPTILPAASALAREFFASQMYLDTTATITSTSSLGKSAVIDVFNFHPVCAGGLGVSYAFSDGVCEFCFNFFAQEDGEKFKSALGEFFAKFNALA